MGSPTVTSKVSVTVSSPSLAVTSIDMGVLVMSSNRGIPEMILVSLSNFNQSGKVDVEIVKLSPSLSAKVLLTSTKKRSKASKFWSAIAFVERHLPPGSLNKVKVLILRSAWEHTSYATIAREENYDVDYIKKSASQLWKLIAKQLQTDVDVKTKVKVSKKNFRSFLLQYIEQSGYSNGQLQPKINNQPIQQWGTAPDVSCFYGRHTEITQLQNWIVTEKSRLVVLLGIGGIGKTSFSVKIARELAPNFDYVTRLGRFL